MREIECVVTGKVTGVMFRDFVQRKARGAWITGTAQNVGVGAMRVVAQGSEDRLHMFIEALHKGPFLAKVRDVSVVWRDPTGKYSDFTITY